MNVSIALFSLSFTLFMQKRFHNTPTIQGKHIINESRVLMDRHTFFPNSFVIQRIMSPQQVCIDCRFMCLCEIM